ncbi:saccharopine dehydrogenase NADP-binding domain-containing protein [Nocardia sp. NPDC055053]
MRNTKNGKAIAVYGATGYTGRLIVRELVGSGHEVIVAGRDAAGLRRVAERADGAVTCTAIALDDTAGLIALASRVRTVVNAAGPFADTCGPIARAAVAGGAHYVDISGEQHAIRALFDELGPAATERGVALLPASAFYATLCDLLVSLAARDFGPVSDLDIAYHVENWVPSGAAFRNRVLGLTLSTIQFDNGYTDIDRQPATRFVDFGGTIGRRRVAMYPAPEVLTIPRHVDVARLRTSMATSTLSPQRIAEPLVPLLARIAARGLESRAAPVIEKLVTAGIGGSPTRFDSDPTRFDLVAHLTGTAGKRTATLSGPGIFDITGPIAARVAATTTDAGFISAGPLSAAQILDPSAFLTGLGERGVSFRIA